MARTIGRKNKTIIKRTVEKMIRERTTPWGDVNFPTDEEVMEELPENMFETWEGAYSEIKNLINDSIMGYNKKLKKVI